MKNFFWAFLVFTAATAHSSDDVRDQNLLHHRGIITTSTGLKIDCKRPSVFSNSEYRSTRAIFDAENLKFDEIIYATSSDRPINEKFKLFRMAQNLNYPELFAINGYTGGAYQSINHALYTNNASEIENLKLPIQVLCSGLSKLPSYIGTVQRGTPIVGEFEDLKEGDIYINKGFMSTSIGSVDLYKNLKVQLKIHSHNGKRIDYLSNYDESTSNSEKEVLFMARSHFRILKKKVYSRDSYSKRYEIELEEIEPTFMPELVIPQSQSIKISGNAFSKKSIFHSSSQNSEELARTMCEAEKLKNDINGECFINCLPEMKGISQCEWMSSDWYFSNPFYKAEVFNNFYLK